MRQILLGTQGFSHNDWVGPFYPPGTQPADYLACYSRVFPTVELDTTYYRIPTGETVRRWDAQTPAKFVFSTKLFKEITHDRMLKDCREVVSAFVSNMSLLGEKLGVQRVNGYFNNHSLRRALPRLGPTDDQASLDQCAV